MKSFFFLLCLLSLSLHANIVRYNYTNTVYVIDSETGLNHKVQFPIHREIKIINGCLVQYRDRLFYAINPKTGKASRVTLVNHEDIEPMSGCVVRYKQNNTVYYVQPENGRAYKVTLSIHDEIGTN